MKKFVCTICGHLEEGTAPPEKCIVCGQGADKFLDNSALFKLGIACLDEGNPKGAVEWLKKSAIAGNRTAAFNLVLIHRDDQFGMPDKQEFFRWLKKLAYDFKDGWGQVQLGIIYCGTHVGVPFAFFGKDLFVSELNPEEGLRLLNEGVPIAEKKGSPKLDSHDYYDISASYYQYRICAYEGKEGFSKGHERQNLEKELLYTRKHLAALMDEPCAPENREDILKKRELAQKLIDRLEQELDGSIDILTSHQKMVEATEEYFSALGVPGYS